MPNTDKDTVNSVRASLYTSGIVFVGSLAIIALILLTQFFFRSAPACFILSHVLPLLSDFTSSHEY